ncbi:hypothetical protein COOONC_20864 [Cooperia oncophora]
MPLDERKQLVENPFENVWSTMFKDELISNVMERFRTFEGGRLAERADRLNNIMNDMVDLYWADHLAEVLGMERVLCHGDLWSMNILWRENGNELKFTTLVDYQVAHFGCSATDLVRLFSSKPASGNDRRGSLGGVYWNVILWICQRGNGRQRMPLLPRTGERSIPSVLSHGSLPDCAINSTSLRVAM